jgi:hypothetical protein
MSQLVRYLGFALVGCIVVRVVADVVAPLIPLLAVAFIGAAIVMLVFGRTHQ